MNSLTISVPENLHSAIGEFARSSGLTVDQLVTSAIAEKLSALAGPNELTKRAARADRTAFDAAMAKVPDVEPEKRDRL